MLSTCFVSPFFLATLSKPRQYSVYIRVMPVFLPEVFPQKETGLIRENHSSLLWFSPKTAGHSLGLIRLKKAERQSKIKQGRWKAVRYNIGKDVR
jgi:hypothetical protein